MRRLAVLAVLAGITACSAILGFEHGYLRPEDDAATPDGAAQTDGGDAHPDGCANGEKLCSGVCVSIFDTNYGCTLTGCDTCPGVAHATGVCSGPSCGLRCENPFLDCNGKVEDGCETNPLSGDPGNCGTCNRACDAGLLCNPGGICSATCSSGTNCDGGCVDTTNNPNSCGTCNHKCTAGANASPECVNSTCTFKCDTSWANCNDASTNACATNTSTDQNNCGSCGHVCVPGQHAKVLGCSGGKCNFGCNVFYADCDGDGNCECNTGGQGTICRMDTKACGTCSNVGEPCGASSDCCAGFADTCQGDKCCVPQNGSCAGALADSCCSGQCYPPTQKCF